MPQGWTPVEERTGWTPVEETAQDRLEKAKQQIMANTRVQAAAQPPLEQSDWIGGPLGTVGRFLGGAARITPPGQLYEAATGQPSSLGLTGLQMMAGASPFGRAAEAVQSAREAYQNRSDRLRLAQSSLSGLGRQMGPADIVNPVMQEAQRGLPEGVTAGAVNLGLALLPGFRGKVIPREANLANALDLGSAKFDAAGTIETALPELQKTLAANPALRAGGVKALNTAIDMTLARLGNEFNLRLNAVREQPAVGPNGNIGAEAASNIRAAVGPGEATTHPEFARAMERMAKRWEKLETWDELNNARESARKHLDSFEGKGPVQQSITMRTSGLLAADKIAMSTVQRYYDLLGTGTGDLQATRSALLSLKRAGGATLRDLSNQALSNQAEPWLSRMTRAYGVRTYVHPSGGIGMVMHPERMGAADLEAANQRANVAMQPNAFQSGLPRLATALALIRQQQERR